jgi:hypothetical protein
MQADGSRQELPQARPANRQGRFATLVERRCFETHPEDEEIQIRPDHQRLSRDCKNSDENTSAGGCRPVDLTAPPFNVKGKYIFKFTADEPKVTFLWQR